MTTSADLIASLCVPTTLPIYDAVEVLNSAHRRIVLVVDDDRRLLGVLADSNVRRAVLARIDFQRPIADIMVTTPVTVDETTPESDVLTLMEKTGVLEVPILDAGGRVVGMHSIDELLSSIGRRPERVAVVMAGGLGSRLHPLTAEMPKPLIPVGDRPILFILLDHLLAAGFDRIWITLNYKGAMIREAVGQVAKYRAVVSFVEEKERMGTAGALALIEPRPTAPFVLLNGDLLTKVAFDQMLRFHQLERNLVTVALKEEVFKIPYGVAKVEGTRITDLVEKPEHRVFISAGVYIVDPSIIERMPKGAFYDMTDVIGDLLRTSHRVGSFPVHEYWLDVGGPAQLVQAQSDYAAHFEPATPNR